MDAAIILTKMYRRVVSLECLGSAMFTGRYLSFKLITNSQGLVRKRGRERAVIGGIKVVQKDEKP